MKFQVRFESQCYFHMCIMFSNKNPLKVVLNVCNGHEGLSFSCILKKFRSPEIKTTYLYLNSMMFVESKHVSLVHKQL